MQSYFNAQELTIDEYLGLVMDATTDKVLHRCDT